MARLWLLLALLAASPAAAQTVAPGTVLTGAARALDGDTIWLDGRRVRLWGIDAPEMTDWPLGNLARAWLDELLRHRELSCTVVSTDRYKRPIAWCAYDGSQQGPALGMLLAGHAVVYRRYTLEAAGPLAERAARYDRAEDRAREAALGLWRAR